MFQYYLSTIVINKRKPEAKRILSAVINKQDYTCKSLIQQKLLPT